MGKGEAMRGSVAMTAGEPQWAEEGEKGSLQARLEGHPLGRAVISGVLVFVLTAIVVSNLPASELRREAMPVVEPVLDATALGQSWNLFAPDPRNSTLRLVARMTYPDGTTVQWHQPEGEPVLSPYRAYRWRKFAVAVMSDGGEHLRPAFAAWLARHHRRNGAMPERVVLVKQVSRAPEPGSGEMGRPGWQEEILHRSTVTGGEER